MGANTLNIPLQQSVLCLLVHDNNNGRLIANMVTAELFDGDYSEIARAALRYWKAHAEAPRHHLADMLGDIVGDSKNPRSETFRGIIHEMLHLYDAGLNATFYVDRVSRFIRMQQVKQAIVAAANKLHSKADTAIEEIEDTLADLLKVRAQKYDPGLQLTDIDQVIDFLETKNEEFAIGIDPLDQRNIVPSRGAVMLMLGATGKGKSWGLIHIGKLAITMRFKVLHVTLEMPKEEVIQRYWQSLFNIGRREVKSNVTLFERTNSNKLDRLVVEQNVSDFSLSSPHLRDEIEQRLMSGGTRLQNNLRVINFSSGSLRPRDLEAYLDTLEQIDKFVPDMVILDYIGLMRADSDLEYRLAISQNMVRLRAMAQDRKFALVTAQQVGRAGAKAKLIGLTHVAEDWTLTNTADTVITYTTTAQELKYGLGRIYVAKARGAADNFAAWITQNYAVGQFCIDAIALPTNYVEKVQELEGFEQPTEDEEEEELEEGDNSKGRR